MKVPVEFLFGLNNKLWLSHVDKNIFTSLNQPVHLHIDREYVYFFSVFVKSAAHQLVGRTSDFFKTTETPGCSFREYQCRHALRYSLFKMGDLSGNLPFHTIFPFDGTFYKRPVDGRYIHYLEKDFRYARCIKHSEY